MRKKEKITNRVSALLLSGVIMSGLIVPAFSFDARAEALPEILESTATVADCVMSYYAMSGSAVANTEWINTLYNSLGSSFGTVGQFCNDGLLTYADQVWQPTQELINNIENASAYTELGLDSVFNVSAEEVSAGGGLAVATGGTTLAGATGCVASTGILPVLGGVTAAYWGGIGVGTIVNHLVEKYKNHIYRGASIDTAQSVLSQNPTMCISSYKVEHSGNYYKEYIFYPRDCLVVGLNNYDGWLTLKCVNPTSTTASFPWVDYRGRKYNRDCRDHYAVDIANLGENYSFSGISLDYNNSDQQIRNWYSNVDSLPAVKSPDMIGEDGNLYASEENGNVTVPDMKPQIDPGTQAGKPLSLQDWLDFANQVQNNNNNVTPTPDGNQGLFDDIMDLVRTVIPNPDPDPDPGPNPDPETYPVPGPVPTPTPVPDPDYQPETRPQPDFTEKQTENQTDITEGDPWTTPDLLDKFPFCIPKDIYRVFTKLDSKARSAPHIQWRFHPNNMIDYTFDIDFSEWDSIATLLRTLELLAFIVGLAIGTRRLIIGG